MSNRSRERNRSHKRRRLTQDNDCSDFINMFSDLLSKVNIKIAFGIFILGIIIFSDCFIETFLVGIDGATDEAELATHKGTIIQLTMLTLGYIVIDLLSKGDII